MNVIALIDFHDNLRDVDRKAGEEFVVSRERFEQINAIGVEKIGAPLVREMEHSPAAVGKQTPESRAKKAPAKRRAKAKDGE